MTFSLNEERKKAFPVVETGEYNVIMESCTLANNKPKDDGFVGQRYDVMFKVIEGDKVNATFKIIFNKKVKNDQTVAGSLNSLVILAKLISSQNTDDTQLRILSSKIYKDKFTSIEDAFANIMEKSVLEQKPFKVSVIAKPSTFTDTNTGEVKDGRPNYSLVLNKSVEDKADEVLKKYLSSTSSTTANKKADTKEVLNDEIPV